MTSIEKIDLLRQAVMVAIVQLYHTDKEDVLNTFSMDELQVIVDSTEKMKPRQVEDIYKEALKVSEE